VLAVLDLTKNKRWEQKTAELVRRILAQPALALKKVDLSIVLLPPPAIARLNNYWRGQKGATDVLSFSLKEPGRAAAAEIFGEIFICPKQVLAQAKTYKQKPRAELTRVLVHGILHLQGLKHESGGRAAAEMLTLQEKIVKRILVKAQP